MNTKVSKIKYVAVFMIMFFIAAYIPTKNVSAASDVTQTAATATSITFKWNTPAKSSYMQSMTITKYEVGIGTTLSAAETSAKKGTRSYSASTHSCTISSLGASRQYYIYIRYTYNYVSTGGYSYTGSTSYMYGTCKTLPAKVTGLSQEPGIYTTSTRYVYFDWGRIKSVDGYQYLVYDYSNKLVSSKLTTSASGTFDTATSTKGAQYKVHVRGYNTINGKKVYGPWSNWLYIVPQPEIVTANITSANKLSLKWTKVTGVNRYEVFISQTGPRSGYKKVATLNSSGNVSTVISTYNNKAFNKQSTYYIYVRAVRVVGDKTFYSDVSRIYIQ